MSKHILLVDDDRLLLMTLKRILKGQGYKVSTAPSGEAALSRVQYDDYDLIISDLKMPHLDGIETVKRIREYLAQNAKPAIPEIFITGYAKEEIFQNALQLGAAGYIEKPFDIKTLLQTAKEVIEAQTQYK